MKDVLDALIAERAPWLYSNRAGVGTVRAALHRLLGYRKTVALAAGLRDLPAQQIMSVMAELLARNVNATGTTHIPKNGPALIVANHPTGIADGIVLHKLLSAHRSDVFYFANNDILRVFPQMDDIIVPVEWRMEKRSHGKTRETMAQTHKAFEAGKMGVIFPSGRLAKRKGLRLHERPWMGSAAMIARKFELPILPIRIEARNSMLFYGFDALHPTMRDITLFHETLNKQRQVFDVTIGRQINHNELPRSSEAAIEMLKNRVLRLEGKPAALPLVHGKVADWSHPLQAGSVFWAKHRYQRRT